MRSYRAAKSVTKFLCSFVSTLRSSQPFPALRKASDLSLQNGDSVEIMFKLPEASLIGYWRLGREGFNPDNINRAELELNSILDKGGHDLELLTASAQGVI